jgi:hypothetical protein
MRVWNPDWGEASFGSWAFALGMERLFFCLKQRFFDATATKALLRAVPSPTFRPFTSA